MERYGQDFHLQWFKTLDKDLDLQMKTLGASSSNLSSSTMDRKTKMQSQDTLHNQAIVKRARGCCSDQSSSVLLDHSSCDPTPLANIAPVITAEALAGDCNFWGDDLLDLLQDTTPSAAPQQQQPLPRRNNNNNNIMVPPQPVNVAGAENDFQFIQDVLQDVLTEIRDVDEDWLLGPSSVHPALTKFDKQSGSHSDETDTQSFFWTGDDDTVQVESTATTSITSTTGVHHVVTPSHSPVPSMAQEEVNKSNLATLEPCSKSIFDEEWTDETVTFKASNSSPLFGIDTTMETDIAAMKSSEHPIVLTLTSFPFRVLYTNDAYTQMTGRKMVMGEPFYDLFVQEGLERPSVATCSTPLGMFEREVVRVKSSSNGLPSGCFSSMNTSMSHKDEKNDSSIMCTIQVQPVYKATSQNEKELRCYSVVLGSIPLPEGSHNRQVVYLPMPSGVMKSPLGEQQD